MKYPVLSANALFNSDESIYIHKSTDLPEFVEKFHKHDFIEIFYVVSGECEHIEYYDENIIKKHHAKKGDLFIINNNVAHADIQNPNSTEPFGGYDCAFTPDFIDNSLSREQDFFNIKSSFFLKSMFSKEKPITPILSLTNNALFEFEQVIKKMHTEYINKKTGYYDLLRAYLIEFLIMIFRKMEDSSNIDSSNKQDPYIKSAIDYIEGNYSQKIKLENIAYLSFLSKSYFCQLFKESTGLCFSDYLQKVRINHASELLLSTNLTVSDIAERTGFNDTKFFYSVFKRYSGKTPGEFRNQNATPAPNTPDSK